MKHFSHLMRDLKNQSKNSTEKGDLFEKISATYLLKSPEFHFDNITIEKFEKWSRKHGAWSGQYIDLGIDLVITNLETDEHIAIQCKYRDEEFQNNLQYEAVSNFINQAKGDNGVKFKRLILITNLQDASKNLHSSLNLHNISFYGAHWFNETNLFLKTQYGFVPEKITDLSQLSAKPSLNNVFTARPHQQSIINSVEKALTYADKTTINAACGIGKSFISLKLIANSADTNSTNIIFVPTLMLAQQFIQFIHTQKTSKQSFETIAVCSDESVVEANLYNLDFNTSEITTLIAREADDITQFITNNKNSKSHKIIIATYHSAYKIKQSQIAAGWRANFAIFDEAHKTTTMRGQSALFIDAAKQIFMTATPRIIKTSKHNSFKEFSSMDNTDVYGKIDTTYSFRQAIDEDVLTSYKIEILLTEDKYVDYVNNPQKTYNPETKSEIHTQLLTIGKIGLELQKEKKIGIAYFNSVKASKLFVKVANSLAKDRGLIHQIAWHIDGSMTSSQRKLVIEEASLSGGLISNVSVLTEGIDLPELEAVIFAEARSSQIDIVQAIGRVMRKSMSNPQKVGRIILPLAATAEADATKAFLNNNQMTAIKNVLISLVEYDNVLYDAFIQAVSVDRKNYSNSDEKFKYLNNFINIFDFLPKMTQAEVSHFLDSLKFQILTIPTLNWWRSYSEYKNFYQKNNKNPIYAKNKNLTPNQEQDRLALWGQTQKALYNKNTLDSRKVEALEQLPSWYWSPSISIEWEKNLQLLHDFMQTNSSLPSTYAKKSAEERKIANWVAIQKRKYRKNALTFEQRKKIEHALGLSVESHPRTRTHWEEVYEELTNFIHKNNRLPFATSIDLHEKKLGVWRNSQKQAYMGTTVKALSNDQKEKLSALPLWDWGKKNISWDDAFEEVQIFIEKNKRYPIPSKTEEAMLGLWVNKQKTKHQNTQEYLKAKNIKPLSEIQKTKLSSLPNWYASKEDSWLDMCSQLEQWFAMNPNNFIVDIEFDILKLWTSKQQAYYKAGTLAQEYVFLLEELPNWEWKKTINAAWAKNFRQALTWFESYPLHSNLNIPSDIKAFLKKQHTNYHQLSILQKKMLIEVPTWITIKLEQEKAKNALPSSVTMSKPWNMPRQIVETINSKAITSIVQQLLVEKQIPLHWSNQYLSVVNYRENYAIELWEYLPNELLKWLAQQKTAYKRQTLSPLQLELLQKIDLNPDVRFISSSWLSKYQVAQQWKDNNKQANIFEHPDLEISSWVGAQLARKNSLSEKQRQLLYLLIG